MKTKIILIIAINLLCLSYFRNHKVLANRNLNLEDSINVFSTPDLLVLTSNWAREYSILYPSIKIQVNKFIDPLIVNKTNSEGNLYFISKQYYSVHNNDSIWSMGVGLDVIVPIINSKNPCIDEINQQGITVTKISQFLKNNEFQIWENQLINGRKIPVNYYQTDDESIKSDVANFLKIDKKINYGIRVESDEEMIAAIQKDPYAIGFCNVASILDANKKNLVQGIKLLPIDKNGNGKIDYNEKIYDDINSFLRGVWVGKYPKELCRNIYSVSPMKPTNENEVAFLAWVLTEGQQYLNPNGFGYIASIQRQTNINELYPKKVVETTSNNRFAIPLVILILIACVIIFFAVDLIVQRFKPKDVIGIGASKDFTHYFNNNSVVVSDGIYFDKSHTWAFMEKDGVVGIGIDDFLQHITGPITRIKMKNTGEKIRKGEHFLTIIQEGKQLNICAPISGTIVAQNRKLIENTSILNSYPYSHGWVYMIEPTNWLREIQFLFMAETYKEWLKKEFIRLKDFLAVAIKANYDENAQIILQDGGEIKNGILKDLKPEVWEDFQTNFLDSSK